MTAEKLRHIGKLAKLHGFNGEALAIFDEAYLKKITKTEWVFVIIDGLPVPFFLSDIEIRSGSSAVIKILDVDSADAMKELIGCDISIIDQGKNRKKEQFNLSGVKGFVVLDLKMGKIGIAKELLNYNNNFVLQIYQNEKEILIPVADEIVLAIDQRVKTITVDLPQGLLDLYS